MKRFTFLLLLSFSLSASLYANGVDFFNSSGTCFLGNTLTVSAHCNTSFFSKCNWQYKDKSNVWNCFVNGSNTVNGTVCSVSGALSSGFFNTSPVLNISNCKTNLEDVEVRLAICDNSSPCSSTRGSSIEGIDKCLRLHVLCGTFSNGSAACNTGGCEGNLLCSNQGYYGGFEISNKSCGSASSDYNWCTSNSSCGQYSLINHCQQIFSFLPKFAPHSGNYMMYCDGSSAAKNMWKNTISVIKGNAYHFGAWICNANNTNNQKAIVCLKISGPNSAQATKSVTATAGEWQYCQVDYVASQSCTVDLTICDLTTSCPDNDFCIDDICCVCNGPAPTVSLGDQLWNDFDGDGKRDGNEPGIGGATISLYTDNNSDNLPDGAAVKTTVSDSKGSYLFTGLLPGRYIASLPVLPGYQRSPNTSSQATSPFPDNDVDNDDNLVRLVGANGPGGVLYTNAITLSVNGEPTTDGNDAKSNLTFDLAECGNSGIGDFVWNDVNGNGIQDAGEPGINGVPVTITFSDGRTATTTTATYNAANNANAPQYDGYYNFINLGPDTYKISFGVPAGLHASPSNAGGNDAKDSDPVNGGPVTLTLAANQSNFTIDAGFTNYTPPAKLTLGNMVFLDINGNGVKDSNEPGIAGLTVKVYADNNGDNLADGGAVAPAKNTAADGSYSFDNLAPGKYMIGVTTGTAYVLNPIADLTPDDNKDNDNNGYLLYNGDVFTKSITLSAGNEPNGTDNNSNLTLDIGLKTAPCPNHCDCHNDCTHTGCGHSNCGHNSCKNNCTHTGCGHSNCGHNSCKNDCTHTGCGHSNCGHNSCNNNCTHTSCGHSNCGKAKCGNNNEDITITTVSVFPNPCRDYCTLKVDAVKSGEAQIRITDLFGRLMISKTVTLTAGTNSMTFNNLGSYSSGLCYIQILYNYHVYNQQLLLLK